ncbi:aminoacyl-tRNA deacylase [Thaumasiovibrio subtropicus]|uniref:aminoacyl-tRNA deacylase n=1 Tax=Thaumasiovibrio subtropicus TaxID=1891207 RepID=UPI000B34C3EB|nr:YbaK/EbsC family protein [Thaumasiovibrio subtropicus]
MNESWLQTSVTATLDIADIPYQILWHQRPATSIEDAAAQRGVEPKVMVKTMLLEDMGGVRALACLPGDQQVDPRKVREVLGCRRMTCVSADKVRQITGYTPGTVTPLALPVPLPVIVDPQLQQHDTVTISSGDPMAGLALNSSALFALISPQFAAICRET